VESVLTFLDNNLKVFGGLGSHLVSPVMVVSLCQEIGF